MYLILMDGFYREYRIIWYINHGEGGTAKNRMKSELRSQVQGHLHTQLYVCIHRMGYASRLVNWY
jgi:hypothetical protein